MDLTECINEITDKNNADVFLLSGGINQKNIDEVINEIRSIKVRHENFILLLTTWGGSADDGYRLIGIIKKKYKKFTLFVFGDCKSAGTLIALGADEIVMSDFGQFGPLDIQLSKDDEFVSSTSGLNYIQSLVLLQEQAFTLFDNTFFKLKKKYYNITTKTAAEISTNLTVGLLAPIANQIDPIKLVDVHRSIKIAEEYGKRLIGQRKSDSDKEKMITKLVSEYPSHNFVIDYKEAKEVFGDVIREPDETELLLENNLFHIVREQAVEKPMIWNLTKLAQDTKAQRQKAQEEKEQAQTTQQSTENEPESK